MKTFKQFGATIRGVTLSCIFTLHHISLGFYWSAPAFKEKRLVTLSIHLPFFIASVSFVTKKADLPKFEDIIGLYADD